MIKKIVCFVVCMIFMTAVFSGAVYAEEADNVNIVQNNLSQESITQYNEKDNLSDNSNQISDAGGSNPENGELNENGVSVSKKISSAESENYFDIELTVKTSEELSELENKQKTAMVVVLDKSYTMNTNAVNSDISRLEAAKKAAKILLNTACESEIGLNGSMEVGFVAFDTNAASLFDLTKLTPESIKELNKLVDGIETASSSSHERFTNIEAGIVLADNMLTKSKALNKYIVLLTDGFPTTYINNLSDKTSIDYINGYDPYMSDYTGERNYGTDGYFIDPIHYNIDGKKDRETTKGTSYSDKAADRAQAKAEEIKSKGTKIFTIGIDIGGQNIQDYIDDFEKFEYSSVDCYKTSIGGNYIIGKANDKNSYKNWLTEKISSADENITYYFDGNNLDEMKTAYDNILASIKEINRKNIIDKWFVSDPMEENIEFKYFYDKNNNNAGNILKGENGENKENTAGFISETNKISWDLKNSGFNKKVIESDSSKITYYVYTLKYRVRLQNEKSDFIENKIYNTNGETFLNYVISENGNLSEKKSIEFPVPKVIGYLGNLVFNKVSSDTGKGIANVEFKLEHSPDCSVCKGEVNINPRNIFSSKEDFMLGSVSFSDVPSGHEYILTEVSVPEGYLQNENKYTVSVNYGKTKLYENGKEVLEILNVPIEKDVPEEPLITVVSKNDSPKTGDESNILISVLLLFVSLIGIGFVIFKKKFMK